MVEASNVTNLHSIIHLLIYH